MLIQYNYKLYSVTDIVSCLLKNTEVADFSIKDLEIEDVIKRYVNMYRVLWAYLKQQYSSLTAYKSAFA